MRTDRKPEGGLSWFPGRCLHQAELIAGRYLQQACGQGLQQTGVFVRTVFSTMWQT